MAEMYIIPDNKDLDETISMSECRKIREITNMLTSGCLITKREYVRLMVVYDGILKRMEKECENN